MTEKRQALLLVGSPRVSRSTSGALGGYLLEKLKERGFAGEKIFLHQASRNRKDMEGMRDAVNAAEVVVLAFPTYIDFLPAPVIRVLGDIAAGRRAPEKTGRPRFLAIANCGFPEAHHNEVALACCRRFAEETGMVWVGGLGLGGGGALNGEPLESRKGMARNIIRSLDMTADALAGDRPVPEAATDLMARPLIPRWLYLRIGTWGWKRQARRFGTTGRLQERPWSE